MPNPQKAKGSSWERDVAKYLSNLYGESFIRAPGSGAYVGGKNYTRTEFLHEGQIRSFKGDIVPGESFPKFNAEAKNYKDFPFHQLFSGTVKKLEEWIEQCMSVADPDDFNILFLKFNNKGKYIVVNADKQTTPLKFDRHFTYNSSHHGTWFIMDFELFFQLNKDTIKQLCG